MESEDIGRFFESLRPYIQTIKVDYVDVIWTGSEIINKFSEFLSGNLVSSVIVHSPIVGNVDL